MEVALNLDLDPTEFLWLDPSTALPSRILIQRDETPPHSAAVSSGSGPIPNLVMAGQSLLIQAYPECHAPTARRGFLPNAFRHLDLTIHVSQAGDMESRSRLPTYHRTQDFLATLIAASRSLPKNLVLSLTFVIHG
jgi:hypothetical protein